MYQIYLDILRLEPSLSYIDARNGFGQGCISRAGRLVKSEPHSTHFFNTSHILVHPYSFSLPKCEKLKKVTFFLKLQFHLEKNDKRFFTFFNIKFRLNRQGMSK